MKRIEFQEYWPASWKTSYHYDCMEIYGEGEQLGYRYAYEERQKQILELVVSVARPGSRILDVAAAQGNFSLSLAERGYRVTWNDIRVELIDYVRAKWEQGAIDFLPGNVFEVSASESFDVVLASEVIEHVAHPDQFLTKICKLVKPGGYLVLTTPNGAYFRNTLPKFSDCPDPSCYESLQFKPNSDGHIFLLYPDELMTLAGAAGFSLLQYRLFNNPLTSGHVKLGKLLPFLSRSVVRGLERFTQELPTFVSRRLHSGMGVLLHRI